MRSCSRHRRIEGTLLQVSGLVLCSRHAGLALYPLSQVGVSGIVKRPAVSQGDVRLHRWVRTSCREQARAEAASQRNKDGPSPAQGARQYRPERLRVEAKTVGARWPGAVTATAKCAQNLTQSQPEVDPRPAETCVSLAEVVVSLCEQRLTGTATGLRCKRRRAAEQSGSRPGRRSDWLDTPAGLERLDN